MDKITNNPKGLTNAGSMAAMAKIVAMKKALGAKNAKEYEDGFARTKKNLEAKAAK